MSAEDNQSEAAFPCPASENTVLHQGVHPYQVGMSLRDYFAAKAMQSYAANPDYSNFTKARICAEAYEYADLMLAERSTSTSHHPVRVETAKLPRRKPHIPDARPPKPNPPDIVILKEGQTP